MFQNPFKQKQKEKPDDSQEDVDLYFLFEGEELHVPKDLMDLSIDQFIAFFKLVTKEGMDLTDPTTLLNIIRFLTSMSEANTRVIDSTTAAKVIEMLTPCLRTTLPEVDLSTSNKKKKNQFIYEGKKWDLPSSFSGSDIDRVADLENFLQRYEGQPIEVLHYLVAFLAREVQSGVISTTRPDLDEMNDLARFFLNVKMRDVYQPIFFFLNERVEFYKRNETLFEGKNNPFKGIIPNKAKDIIRKWGLHKVVADLVEPTGLTAAQLKQMTIKEIFVWLNYLKDMNNVKELMDAQKQSGRPAK